MRMARVNITIPDDVLRQARIEGLNVSALATGALVEEFDRRERIVALDAHLGEMEAEHGPVPESELAEARGWADRTLGPRPASRTA